MEPSYTIGELATEAEVNVETIRYYQRRRLFPTPQRPLGRTRRYGRAEVVRLRFIKSAQRLGASQTRRDATTIGAAAAAGAVIGHALGDDRKDTVLGGAGGRCGRHGHRSARQRRGSHAAGRDRGRDPSRCGLRWMTPRIGSRATITTTGNSAIVPAPAELTRERGTAQ